MNMENKKLYLSLRLDFFNESAEKTEKATPKKREKAREEGQVAQSQEISTAAMLIIAFFSLSIFVPAIFHRVSNVFIMVLTNIGRPRTDLMQDVRNIDFMVPLVTDLFTNVILAALPLMLITAGVGFTLTLLQVKWKPTSKPIMPKFSKLNPIKGFKKIFSLKALVELFKSIFKLGLIVTVVIFELMGELDNLLMIMSMPFLSGFVYIGQIAIRLGIIIGVWFVFIAGIDYAYQKYKHEKELKMSKQEIKDEYKQSEGNPQIKGRIRQKMREVSMRRMMQDIPSADVIITNPTHFSVAVKYDKLSIGAPMVVGKGADHLAKRIREIAKENNIMIVENKQLARALYATVDVGREIPPELYKAVAEVLAYVYKIKNRNAV